MNIIHLDFAKKLGFEAQKTTLGVQNINKSRLYLFDIIITHFVVKDKEEKSCFYKKTFLLTNININVTLRMFFLISRNIAIEFVSCHLY